MSRLPRKPYQQRTPLLSKLGWFVFPLLLVSIYSTAATQEKLALTDGWHYHWGDLPFDPKSNQWMVDEAHWEPTGFPEDIPNRANHQIVWLKIDIPKGPWRDPYLFINSIDLTVQTYFNGEKIYQFGSIDQQGNSQFVGWPWHLIELPSNYFEHSLYFRIYSDYPYIGLSGESVIGNRSDLLDTVYLRGATGLTFVLIMLLVTIVSVITGIIKHDDRVAISTGVLSFNLALMMFSENELSQLVHFDPLMWRYVAAFTYFLIPALLSWVIIEWFKEKPPVVARLVMLFSLFFVIYVGALSAFTSFNFVNAYPVFDIAFIIMVLSLLFGCFYQIKHAGLQDGLIVFGIFALFCSLLLDMLSSNGVITWIGRTGQWGLISFPLVSLANYMIKDWRQQIALSAFANSLETQVRERTEELVASKKQLEDLVRQDYLTQLLNRRAFMQLANSEIANATRYGHPLSLVMIDVDHFKSINDTYGHSAGDQVLKILADKIREACREGDLICRYGGEEFVILLYATATTEAANLIERLRLTLEQTEVQMDSGETIRFTASFGLASLQDDKYAHHDSGQLLNKLLTTADAAMYDVKKAGRNDLKACMVEL